MVELGKDKGEGCSRLVSPNTPGIVLESMQRRDHEVVTQACALQHIAIIINHQCFGSTSSYIDSYSDAQASPLPLSAVINAVIIDTSKRGCNQNAPKFLFIHQYTVLVMKLSYPASVEMHSENDTSIPENDAGNNWKIDELAHRSGLTVDTIRFYQREGLLPPVTRKGRSSRYGPVHLRQLERIRELQSHHLSLAAIKSLAEEGQLDLIETLIVGTGQRYERSELIVQSGLSSEFVNELEDAGLIQVSQARNGESYDAADLQVLHAVKGLLELGMPRAAIVQMAKVYLKHFSAIEEELVTLFTGGESSLSLEELEPLYDQAAFEINNLLPLVATILNHIHQRTIQRVTIQAVRLSAEEL